MFPSSSTYQHVPMTNNNNNNNSNNHPKPNHYSTAFQMGDYHNHDHNHLYSSSILLPSILEGVMLSHLNDAHHHHHDMVSSSSQEQHNNVIVKPPPIGSSSSSSSSKKQSSTITTHTTTRSKNKRNKADNNDNKKAKKKDRHSKICTAHGLRDRRMRLSLQIARKFFDLQDMLGFDKASRTIDWLFNKSKAAIKELKDSVVIVDNDIDSDVQSRSEFGEMPCRNDAGKGKAAGNFTGGRRAVAVAVARESRDKARARARERTRDKLLKIKTSGGNNNNNNYNYSNNNYNSDLKMVDHDTDHVNPLLELDYSLMSQQQQQQGQFLGFPNQNYCPFANYTSDQYYCFDDYYTIQEEQKPSHVVSKIPSYYYSYNSNNYSESHHNPSSSSSNNGLVFNMPQNYSRSALRVAQNPNDSSFPASLNCVARMSEDQEENFNPTSDFLSDSNIFRNLNF